MGPPKLLENGPRSVRVLEEAEHHRLLETLRVLAEEVKRIGRPSGGFYPLPISTGRAQTLAAEATAIVDGAYLVELRAPETASERWDHYAAGRSAR